jgi:uncharacterized membrane protein
MMPTTPPQPSPLPESPAPGAHTAAASLPAEASVGMGPNAVLPQPGPRLAAIERMRLLNVALLLSLIALGLAWELWLAPLKGGSGALALKVLPLTLGIAGMLKHRLYTYRWMTLLIWLYFTEGVMRATSDTGISQALAGIEITLSAALFTACSIYVRLRLKVLPPEGKAARKQAIADMP